MDKNIVELVRKIFDKAIDNAKDDKYLAFCTSRDIFEYVCAGNYKELKAYYNSLKEKRSCIPSNRQNIQIMNENFVHFDY